MVVRYFLLLVTLQFISLDAFPEQGADAEKLRIILFIKDSCEYKIPGVFDGSVKEFEKWEDKNKELFSAIREGKEYVKQINKVKRSEKSGVDNNTKIQCANVEEYIVSSVGKATALYETPEKAWSAYIRYLKSADKENAIKCLTSIAKLKFKPALERASSAKLKMMGNSMSGFKLSGYVNEEMASGIAVNKKGKAGNITFVKKNGGWKISDM